MSVPSWRKDTSVLPPPHVYIDIVPRLAFDALHDVVAEESCLLAACDDAQVDARVGMQVAQDALAVVGVAHGRGGAGAIVVHGVELHYLLERFQHVLHHAGAFLRHLAEREHVRAEAQGYTHVHDTGDEDFLVADSPEALDEQTRSVGADVYCRQSHGFSVVCGRGLAEASASVVYAL